MKSSETREEAIIRLYLQNHTKYQIQKATGIRYATITRTIEYFQQNGTIPDPLERGRPAITKLNGTLCTITMLTLQNRTASCNFIADQMKSQNITISGTSVWRMKKELKFDYRPPKFRQILSDQQKENRVKFAYSFIDNNLDPELVIFSDESRFCLTPDNYCIWRRRGETTDDVFHEVGKFDTSVMVFGAIGKNFKSKLVICSGNVDAVEYRSLIEKSELITTCDAMYGAGNYYFMQDGAPAHSSALATLFLQKRVNYLKFWPANSPDLNPIQHVWGMMKRILKQKQFNSLEELTNEIMEIWESISIDVINSLIESFEGRLHCVLAEDGNSISDFLRKGIHFPLNFPIRKFNERLGYFELVAERDETIDDAPIELLTKRPWDYEEIELLMRLIPTYGNKWSQMAGFFVNRTPNSIRNKAKQLKSKI